MDVNKLLKALDDDSNETLLNFTTKTIREMTLKILKELHLPKQETIDIFNKLKDYKYVKLVINFKWMEKCDYRSIIFSQFKNKVLMHATIFKVRSKMNKDKEMKQERPLLRLNAILFYSQGIKIYHEAIP